MQLLAEKKRVEHNLEDAKQRLSDTKQLCDKERSARAQLAERVEELQKSLDRYKHELDEAEALLKVNLHIHCQSLTNIVKHIYITYTVP